MKKKIAGLAAVAALALTGCGMNDSMRDYEEAKIKDPEEITLWNNVDLHPNVARLCVDGVALLTTTREYGDAAIRIPEWDAHCKTVGDRASKNTN